MDYYFDIMRLVAHLVAPLLQAAYEHPATAVAAAFAWDALLAVGGAAIMYVITEHVFKRAVSPAPSPTEDALVGRVEALSRDVGRAEAGEDAARAEADRLREERDAERRRADRLEAALHDALRPPRGRMRPRARRRRRRGRQ